MLSGGLVGTYALAVLDERHPDRIVVARNGSPLIVGVGEKEMLVASDAAALVRHTTRVVHLDDGELATVTATGFTTFDRAARDTTRDPVEIEVAAAEWELTGHRHYMYKEMLEQPEKAAAVIRGRLDERFATARLNGLNLTPRELRAFRRVKLLGCGSAYYVAQIGRNSSRISRASRRTPRPPRSSGTATRSSNPTRCMSLSPSPVRPPTPRSPSRRSSARAVRFSGSSTLSGRPLLGRSTGGSISMPVPRSLSPPPRP